MYQTNFAKLLNNYCFWKNGERDASKLEPRDLIFSYLLETEFVLGVTSFFASCLREAESSSIPFAGIESNFLRFLTAQELSVLSEVILQQKIEECNDLIEHLNNESD